MLDQKIIGEIIKMLKGRGKTNDIFAEETTTYIESGQFVYKVEQVKLTQTIVPETEIIYGYSLAKYPHYSSDIQMQCIWEFRAEYIKARFQSTIRSLNKEYK